MDFYLMIGQSNMAGRAEIEKEDKKPLRDVFLLDGQNCWQPAEHPYNLYSNIRKEAELQKLGPCYSFAVKLQRRRKPFGLVVNARGGTSLTEWLPGAPEDYFGKTVTRVKAAQKSGKLRAIFWSLGETDAQNYIAWNEDEVKPYSPQSYLNALSGFVKDLRSALDVEPKQCPFLCSEVLYTLENDVACVGKDFNFQIIAEASQKIPNALLVSSRGLLDIGDGMHFNSVSQRILGTRFAYAYLNMESV